MDRYAVIGLGKFGYRLAVLLAEAGAEVIAVDRDSALVENIRDTVALSVAMDTTDERALLAQGLNKVDVAVVGIGADFESNLLTTVILKQLGVPRVVSRAITPSRGEILRRIGADALVNPEEESAHRWAHRLLGPNVIEQIPLAEGYSLAQVPVPAGWRGKSLVDLDVRRKYGINVVAIRHAHAEQPGAPATDTSGEPAAPALEMPLPHTKLDAGDILILIGTDKDVASLPK